MAQQVKMHLVSPASHISEQGQVQLLGFWYSSQMIYLPEKAAEDDPSAWVCHPHRRHAGHFSVLPLPSPTSAIAAIRGVNPWIQDLPLALFLSFT